MRDWYVDQNGQITGPFSWEELRFLSARRRVTAMDRIRRGSSGSWVAAETVRGLIDQAAPRAPLSAPPTKGPSVTESTGPATAPGAQPPITAPPPLPPVVPPPLPRTPAGDAKRRVVAAVAGLLTGLALILLIALALWFGTATPGGSGVADGSGAGNGGASIGNGTAGSQDQGSSGSDEGPGGRSPREDESDGNKPEQSEADGGPSSETPEAPRDPAADAGGADGAGDGSPEEPPPDEPPPSSAAVIAPIDEDASPGDPNGVDPSGSGGSAEFFQIKGKGRRFVYVVDCSQSMVGPPFDKARAELQRSINELNSGQSFSVIFFDSAYYPQFWPKKSLGLLRASNDNKGRVQRWIDEFQPFGLGTDPREALLRALALGPDAIYLLTDGVFDPAIADAMKARNRKRTAIHTVSFITRDAEMLLQKIARDSGGTYRYVP